MNKGLTEGEAKSIIMNFAGLLNFKTPLDYRVRASWKELYGIDGTGGGGYHSAKAPGERGIIAIAAGNHKSATALKKTLQHEVLGHFLINTYSPTEKRQVLENIILSQESPSLMGSWNRVRALYPEMSISMQAEEVYARVSEHLNLSKKPIFHEDPCLKKECQPLTLNDLENSILNRICDLKEGLLEQKTFPDNDVHKGVFISSSLEKKLERWRSDHGVVNDDPSPPGTGPRI
ncbi:hypothetical protein [Microbulbifer epialgicus]|uniref:IrrE N-terminal-like domain-containing protein n=1 Tax=Microbulbifer epialgicus TaxID=393907 RepID=A0ABV4NTL2_9GAMM